MPASIHRRSCRPIMTPASRSRRQKNTPQANRPRISRSFAARRYRRNAKRRAASWPLSRLQSAILALALINIVLVAWRRDVVRIMPQTASFYAMLGLPVNLRGLAFDNVATATEQHEGVPILVVEGNVYNSARKTEDVPRLKFIVRNAARQEIYSWSLRRRATRCNRARRNRSARGSRRRRPTRTTSFSASSTAATFSPATAECPWRAFS